MSANQLDERYEVFGCKGCRYFVGSEDGGNFFGKCHASLWKTVL
jgi:hypothetical protein